MGIDYYAIYGLGYQIDTPNIDADLDSDIESYLESISRSTPFAYGIGGNYFTGNLTYFIFIQKPNFNDTKELATQKEELNKFIKKHNFKTLSLFGIIGDCVVS